MDRPCHQNALWTSAKENPKWRTTNRKTLPWWSEEAIQGHPQSLPLRLQQTSRVGGTDCTGSNKVARLHKKGCWRIWSKTNQWSRAEICSHIFLLITYVDCGYLLEPPGWGCSNENPQSMFLSRNKKINVDPCKPPFYCINVGLKGVKTT